MPDFVTGLIQDLKFALREAWKRPALSVTSVLVLAIGLGGSTAAFSVVYQVVLKPIPYPDPERLVFIHNQFPHGQVPVTGVSGFDYATVRGQRDVFSDAAVFFWNDLVLTGAGEARHLDVVNTSSSLFSVLGVKPQLGWVYDASEDRRGAPGTAVLSDRLWRGQFGGNRHILGRTIRLNGSPFTVVGVMPPSFAFPSRETQLWIPLALPAGEFTIQGGRLEKWLHMIARLAPGVDLRKGDSALRTITARLAASYPAFYRRKTAGTLQ